MSREQIDKCWEDKANWKWGVIYSCKDDLRVIVPRRWRWGGWTLNFAHPRAGIIGLMAFALAVGPTILALYLFASQLATLVVMFLSIAALISWAHLESSRSS